MSKWRSRSTIFAGVILLTGIVALFTHFLSGGEFVALASVVHTCVAGRAIAEDHAQQGGSDEAKG